MSEDLKVHDSSGNVFQDMGMPGAEERLAKAELARLIRRRFGSAGSPRSRAPRFWAQSSLTCPT